MLSYSGIRDKGYRPLVSASFRPKVKPLTSLRALELVDQIFIGYSVYYYTVTYVPPLSTPSSSEGIYRNFGNVLMLVTSDAIW